MFHKRITLCRWLGLSSSSRLKFLMTRSRLVIVLKSVNNTYLQSQWSLFFYLSECSYHHHHLLCKPAIYIYSWNDHHEKSSCSDEDHAQLADWRRKVKNLFTIRFWRFWTKNTKSGRHRNTKKNKKSQILKTYFLFPALKTWRTTFVQCKS